MDLPQLSPEDWQRAIKDSWLLVESQDDKKRLEQIIETGHFIYFADSHQGKRPQVGADQLLGQTNIKFFLAHCFYQEAQQAPACERCFVIPNALDIRPIQGWIDFISQFQQEAFVLAHEGKCKLWGFNKQQQQYQILKDISYPKIITRNEIDTLF
jgi:hypothetical protein